MRGKVGCILIVITLALLWGGGQNLFTALTNVRPTTYGFDEYLTKRPKSKWLILKGGVLILPETSFKEGRLGGKVKELYIPVRRDISDNGKIQVLFATKDEHMILLLNTLNSIKGEAQLSQ